MGIWHSSSSSEDRFDAWKRQQLHRAQSGLLQLYPPDEGTTIEALSTKIARSDVLLGPSPSRPPPSLPGTSVSSSSHNSSNRNDNDDQDQYYSIQTLKITRRTHTSTAGVPAPATQSPPPPSSLSSATATVQDTEEPPLVLLHGYMNGAGYFYRNFAGLARSFPQIYALDLLGWGLSSRPTWPVVVATPPITAVARTKPTSHHPVDPKYDDPVAASERFFVNSLEAWRQAHEIDTMILAGHSMGGYLAAAYAERYPHRVDQLVLISPVGVPIESAVTVKRRHERRTASLSYRLSYGLYEWIYRYCTPGDILRHLPSAWGRSRLQRYVERRLPAIDQAVEQSLLADYLYYNATLPGSAEYCLQHLLTPSLFGKRPLVDRIPYLPITACHFFYGDGDWMDANTGGLTVQERCRHRAATSTTGTTPSLTPSPPRVTVHQVRHAGHLLMLDNPDEFNNGVAMVAARSPVLVGSLPSIPQELQQQPSVPVDRPHIVRTTTHSGTTSSGTTNDNDDHSKTENKQQ